MLTTITKMTESESKSREAMMGHKHHNTESLHQLKMIRN